MFVDAHRLPRDSQRDREQHRLLKSISSHIGSKYLSGNNLPQISLICGKLFPDMRLHPISAVFVLVFALVVSG